MILTFKYFTIWLEKQNQYSQQIKDVTIEAGVASIGKNAFDGCSNLSNVTMPDNLTSIGDSVVRKVLSFQLHNFFCHLFSFPGYQPVPKSNSYVYCTTTGRIQSCVLLSFGIAP